MSDDTLVQIQELIDSAQASLKTAHALLREITGVSDSGRERHMLRASAMSTGPVSGRVVEGVFDGQNMVDGNGQTYPVPVRGSAEQDSAGQGLAWAYHHAHH